MESRFALALARDGQRLRLDVFKGLVAAGRPRQPSLVLDWEESSGRAFCTISTRRRRRRRRTTTERDNRGGRWISRE